MSPSFDGPRRRFSTFAGSGVRIGFTRTGLSVPDGGRAPTLHVEQDDQDREGGARQRHNPPVTPQSQRKPRITFAGRWPAVRVPGAILGQRTESPMCPNYRIRSLQTPPRPRSAREWPAQNRGRTRIARYRRDVRRHRSGRPRGPITRLCLGELGCIEGSSRPMAQP